jgi:hypothetical protein
MIFLANFAESFASFAVKILILRGVHQILDPKGR